MKKNKFIVYDPEFINIGHYSRFNKYILELLCKINTIDEIVYLGKNIYKNKKIKFKKLDSLSTFDYRYDSKLKKILFIPIEVLKTLNVIFKLKKNCNNGTLILLSGGSIFLNFFMLIFFKKPFIIYSVGISDLYRKGFIGWIFNIIYTLNYSRSEKIIVTNEINQMKLRKLKFKEVFVLPERNL
tara:strand:+ start:868 stop:1419 length:552 start_codon:yes stop_codon:yes gene_type:complete